MANSAITTATDPQRATQPLKKSPVITAKENFNAQIIKQSVEASVSTQDHPLALVYQAAVNKLNETLAPAFGADALQRGLDEGLDVSPEATAGRIVSLATGFYAAFEKQHVGESEDDVLNQFMETIGRGINQGFAEARQILEGLKVLDGDIADNVNKTFDLVQDGIADFKAKQEVSDE